jgi:hypothetical protein
MSALFLDELPLVRVNTFYLRLTDVPFYETGFSNASLVNLTNVNGTNAIIPGPVGTLPLDQFIYYIIGALVLIICSFAIWAIVKAMIFPTRYLETTRSFATLDAPPPYKTRKSPATARVNTIVRDELGRHRAETKYQIKGYHPPILVEKPNLPIPVVREITDADNPDDGTTLLDIGAWENLVKEKAKLNITIANLQRIAEARRKAGELGAVSPRLLAALQKRANVENSINATYERFKERRGEWSAEEWRVVELIMEYSRRSTV